MDFVRRYRVLYIFLVIFPYLYLTLSYLFSLSPSPSKNPQLLIQQSCNLTQKNAAAERTLIIYVWADTDVQSLGNLEFFVRHAVHPSQPADYYFILQRVNNKTVNETRLPRLPSNAHYIQHENLCYDYGTIGWFLSSSFVKTKLYTYFIFLNASVRGPFFVAYFDNVMTWWFSVFTRRLTDETKLVGPTINCEHKPHVQSYLMATDQVGLSVLLHKDSTVLRCQMGYNDAVVNSEIAASQLMLKANYQIASLQIKYQGVDFRKKENWNCNNRVSPIFVDRSVDGITHDPFELIFVKFKGSPNSFDSDLERRAFVYQKWLEEQPKTQQ